MPVASESEREQARLAEEIERRNAEVERLMEERDRLREEAKTIVAEANSTAEGVINEANAAAQGVISEANARAARLVAEAQQNGEAMVNRLRDEAAAIVSRALGDLTALEATISDALQAAARASVDEPAAAGRLASEGEAPRALTLQEEASPEPAGEPGPFQWLRTALAGRDASPRKESSDTAGGMPFPDGVASLHPETGGDPAQQDSSDEDIFVTRLVIHPSFTADERHQLQERIRGFTGIQRTSLGAVDDDFFELLVTHQLFTSMLGSLLTAAGEHIRLIARHDDSLEIEVTALDWVREGAVEAGRGLHG